MISELIDRKVTIRGASPTAHVKQRLAQAATELNRAGMLQAQCEVINEALCQFTAMLYQRDSDGVLANVDARTGRLLVPAPWGDSGWKQWGLRQWEARILRSLLLTRLQDAKRPPLFDFNNHSRTWYLNSGDYPSLEAATHYLQRGAVKLAEWRNVSGDFHAKEAERKRTTSAPQAETRRKQTGAYQEANRNQAGNTVKVRQPQEQLRSGAKVGGV